jgi:hypothetical protein
MTTPALLDLSAAADARLRLDEGIGRPGDADLAELFERHCRLRDEVLADRIHQIERATWLATQCGVCVLDGFGQECDMHVIEHDHAISRLNDI